MEIHYDHFNLFLTTEKGKRHEYSWVIFLIPEESFAFWFKTAKLPSHTDRNFYLFIDLLMFIHLFIHSFICIMLL